MLSKSNTSDRSPSWGMLKFLDGKRSLLSKSSNPSSYSLWLCCLIISKRIYLSFLGISIGLSGCRRSRSWMHCFVIGWVRSILSFNFRDPEYDEPSGDVAPFSSSLLLWTRTFWTGLWHDSTMNPENWPGYVQENFWKYQLCLELESSASLRIF